MVPKKKATGKPKAKPKRQAAARAPAATEEPPAVIPPVDGVVVGSDDDDDSDCDIMHSPDGITVSARDRRGLQRRDTEEAVARVRRKRLPWVRDAAINGLMASDTTLNLGNRLKCGPTVP